MQAFTTSLGILQKKGYPLRSYIDRSPGKSLRKWEVHYAFVKVS